MSKKLLLQAIDTMSADKLDEDTLKTLGDIVDKFDHFGGLIQEAAYCKIQEALELKEQKVNVIKKKKVSKKETKKVTKEDTEKETNSSDMFWDDKTDTLSFTTSGIKWNYDFSNLAWKQEDPPKEPKKSPKK